MFERVSVTRDFEVLAEALRQGRGQISHVELKGTLALQETSGLILRHGGEIATLNSLQREREMIDSVNRGVGRFERLGEGGQFVASDRLTPEQTRVVEFVLDSRDRAINIRGAAGTGKTATLQELRRGLVDAGRQLVAVAPTMSAVEELRKVGFTDAVTVERLLQDQRMQSMLSGKIVILDEAGMVSGRQMHELLELAELQSARIIFSGDTKQIQSVEAGDALRVLENESRLKSVALSQVQRQIDADYREAIQELRRSPEGGFEKLDRIGAIHQVAWADRPSTVAKAYAESASRNVLVVCATHDEIARVTEEIRSNRKEAGELGKCVQVARDVSLNWTIAQKSDTRNFRPGQRLGFHRAVKDITKNETLDVVGVETEGVIARNDRGEHRIVTPKQAKAFDVFEERTIEVAAGDKLLFTANRRESGFYGTNGEIVTVAHVDEAGHIRLEDGRGVAAGLQTVHPRICGNRTPQPGEIGRFGHHLRGGNAERVVLRCCVPWQAERAGDYER